MWIQHGDIIEIFIVELFEILFLVLTAKSRLKKKTEYFAQVTPQSTILTQLKWFIEEMKYEMILIQFYDHLKKEWDSNRNWVEKLNNTLFIVTL